MSIGISPYCFASQLTPKNSVVGSPYVLLFGKVCELRNFGKLNLRLKHTGVLSCLKILVLKARNIVDGGLLCKEALKFLPILTPVMPFRSGAICLQDSNFELEPLLVKLCYSVSYELAVILLFKPG